jgi:hypothetical protein
MALRYKSKALPGSSLATFSSHLPILPTLASANVAGKGQPKTGGRGKGTPNESTSKVREAIATFAEANVGKMGKWLEEVASEDPGKALDLYLRAIEYHIPKLARQEVTGEDGGPVKIQSITRRIVKGDGPTDSDG